MLALKAAEKLKEAENAPASLMVKHPIGMVKATEASPRVSQSCAFFDIAILVYCVLAFATLATLHVRFSTVREEVKGHRRLNRMILQAVYSNPELNPQGMLGDQNGCLYGCLHCSYC